MTARKPRTVLATALLLTLTALPCTGARAADENGLVRAVPDDVFLCVHGKHNPERAFIEAYWDEVFEALVDTGVGSDIMNLVMGSADPEARAEMERLHLLATELFGNVDWETMFENEMVFAERWAPADVQPKLIMGPPDMVALCRMDAAAAEHNHAALVRILEALESEGNRMAGQELLVLKREKCHGVEVTALTIVDLPPEAPRIRLAVAQRGEIVVIAFGEYLLDDSLALLAGESTATPLVADRRFKDAFAGLPHAQDNRTFFDLQGMLVPYRRLAEKLPAMIAEEGVNDVVLNSTQTGPAHELNMQAWAVYEEGDYQRGLELVQEAYELAPQDSRVLYYLACFHALTGDEEEALGFLERAVDGGFYSPTHIVNDPDLATLRDDPRYEKALAQAREHAAGMTEKQSATWAKGMTAVANRLLDAVGIIDYIASVEYVDGYSVRTESRTALVPDAKQRPIYPVLVAERAHLDEYVRFMPKETCSFSAGQGLDLQALHGFLLDSVRAFGPQGEAALGWWESMQQEMGFDLEQDVLSWIDSESVNVTMDDGQAWVMFMRVKDEALAREKSQQAVEFGLSQISQMAAQNPALGMLSMMASPLNDERLPGFQRLQFVMSPQPIVWGVAREHLIIGSSAEAIVRCLQTADGKHPGIRENERVMAEALLPKGAFNSCSLEDQRSMGKDIAEILGAVTMASGMAGSFIPDPDMQQMLMRVSAMLSKVAPVAMKIDFYKSTASCTTFDGQAWRTQSVTHYYSPEERRTSTGSVVQSVAR